MGENCMTAEEKEHLVDSIANLCIRDVLKREDMVEILRICRDACDRRIAEVEERTRPGGPVQ